MCPNTCYPCVRSIQGGERGVSEIEIALYSPLAKHPEHSEGHEGSERGVITNELLGLDSIGTDKSGLSSPPP